MHFTPITSMPYFVTILNVLTYLIAVIAMSIRYEEYFFDVVKIKGKTNLYQLNNRMTHISRFFPNLTSLEKMTVTCASAKAVATRGRLY
ncbi:MAG: hypothetical protein HOI49_00080 [Bacteroidetes bacterium]|nr:hypothetical protein [Bacteroidota bacterium]